MGLFKKTSQVDKLRKKRERVLKEAFKLSTIDRARSDAKAREAEDIMQEIEKLSNQ